MLSKEILTLATGIQHDVDVIAAGCSTDKMLCSNARVGLDSTERYVDRTTLPSKNVRQFAVVREMTASAD